MFQYDTHNSGFNQATSGPSSDVGTAWTFETGGEVRSSPAVFEGSVFVGSNDGNVYGIDLVTGEEKWAFETGGAVVSSPAVVENTVFVGSNDHSVYAIDAVSGEQQWAFQTGGKVRSSPTIKKPFWREHGTLAIGSEDRHLYYLNIETGKKEFSHAWPGSLVGTPYIANWNHPRYGDMYYVHIGATDSKGSHRAAHLTERSSPKQDTIQIAGVDFLEADAPIYSSFTARFDYQYGNVQEHGSIHYVGDDEGLLHKQSDAGPDYSWKFQTGGKIRSSPALSKDPVTVYFGSWDGNVYAVADDTGKQRWRFETSDKVNSSPAIADGTVYIGSGDHHVYGLDAESGSKIWDFRTGGPVNSAPAVLNGTVFIGSDDGHVYALTACP